MKAMLWKSTVRRRTGQDEEQYAFDYRVLNVTEI